MISPISMMKTTGWPSQSTTRPFYTTSQDTTFLDTLPGQALPCGHMAGVSWSGEEEGAAMAAGGDPQANQPRIRLEAERCTALWGRVSPEGLCCFQGGWPGSLSPPEATG